MTLVAPSCGSVALSKPGATPLALPVTTGQIGRRWPQPQLDKPLQILLHRNCSADAAEERCFAASCTEKHLLQQTQIALKAAEANLIR